MKAVLFAAWALTLWAIEAAAQIPRLEAEKILAAAGSEMEKAAGVRRYEESERHLRAAIEEYRKLLLGGYRSGPLYYNLGNCHLRTHDVGEAVYWLRMAERRIPNDGRLRANLRFARSQVRTKFPPPPSYELLRTLLFFHFLIPLGARWWTFIAFWNLFWIVVCVRVIRSKSPMGRWPIAAVFLIAAVFGLSSGWDLYREKIIREAVIVRDEIVRKGAASTYEPVYADPVSPGVEVEVLQKLERYAEVRFTSGATGWVPLASLRILDREPLG
ncbi:MAG: hypothetical protein A3G34_08575 [Candidatus Lindowbacteria bacterium RIFCSPLOWO2_12_FULL_62_27]|nr:MAG: hypothetical protein A3G34_08575 [Candidatus Lindowbacteria bacterium RIFCSPLOWO2_12_FULL_62_27]OGH62950.1 MAG: hypothetical protein A3I06_13825 [Candidatus Lindowbacteria bacterium RIFCSPLOWO2_02_FULL_62_12]